MKFVLITGPHAVGKMTVGQALAERTGLKLFHNHMTIDLVTQFFPFHAPEARRLIDHFRQEIFEAVANSELPGMIFTYMWAFDAPSDWAYVDQVTQLFKAKGAEIFIVELEAQYDLRLSRNRTENRLAHKPSKRNLEHSEQVFVALEQKYRLNSMPGEVPYKNYLRIDNTHLEPQQCALRIDQWMHLRLSSAPPDAASEINQLIYNSEAYWGEGDTFMSAFKHRYSVTPEWLEANEAYCAYWGNQLVGFLALDMPQTRDLLEDDLHVYLEYFYIHVDHIGTGLGKWLWGQLLAICSDRGIHQLTWITSPGAEGFYLRQGATRIGSVQSTLREGREIPKLTYKVQA